MEKKNEHMIRVALIGPESTAKSTLSEQLARHYKTEWVQEYSRSYLDQIDRVYQLEDILNIAKTQLENEQNAIKRSNKLIFADTELIIAKVWCLDVFKTCPDWILQNLEQHKYDLYLLTYPDIEWQPDPRRENPTRRQFFYDWYEKELKAIDAHYVVIKGAGEERFLNAKKEVDNFLANIKN